MTPGPGAKFLPREAVVNDLDELAAYIQKNSPHAAIRFLEAAQETFGVLARTPELGGFTSRATRVFPECGYGRSEASGTFSSSIVPYPGAWKSSGCCTGLVTSRRCLAKRATRYPVSTRRDCESSWSDGASDFADSIAARRFALRSGTILPKRRED